MKHNKIAFFIFVVICVFGLRALFSGSFLDSASGVVSYDFSVGAASAGVSQGDFVGYCRCITGPYEVDVISNYYGGKGLEFVGFLTFDKCISVCSPGRHSWIPK